MCGSARDSSTHSPRRCFPPCGRNSAAMWKHAHPKAKANSSSFSGSREVGMAQVAEQPKAAPPKIGKVSDPCVMVIFGAAGDLTGRMLIPALYNLARAGLLSREFAVLGVARAQYSDEDFRKT